MSLELVECCPSHSCSSDTFRSQSTLQVLEGRPRGLVMWPELDWLPEAQGVDVSNAISVVLSFQMRTVRCIHALSRLLNNNCFFFPRFSVSCEKIKTVGQYSIFKCDQLCQFTSQCPGSPSVSKTLII